MHPRFPIYVISYKRWDSRLTVKALEEMQVDYKVVVDDFDYDKYAQVIDTKKILVLPNEYRKNYDTFWQDGGTTGSGAARNFVWDHAVASNSQFHWILDDNIDGFVRLHQNKKIKVLTGAYFRCMEDFVLRYENVALAGPHYRFFAPNRDKLPPFQVNTRVFSCILIRNDIPFRWRGRYNEDVDLSLRVLKAGWCTILFYAFLQNKAGTQSVKGGNTDEFYSKEGTFKKSKMIYEMHPDVVKLVWRYGRHHHYVDYGIFKKNKLIRKKDVKLENKINNYGMKLVDISKKENVLLN